MKSVRKHLEAGQNYRSDDGSIEGVIVQFWPLENGSEALVRLHSTSGVVRVFIPGEDRPKRR